MKKSFTPLILIFSILGLVTSQNIVAVTTQEADVLFDSAESSFPQFFSPSGLPSLSFPPDFPQYRGPYSNGSFMAIGSDDSVFVAGGSFGFPATNVGSYASVLALVQGQSSGDDNSICNIDGIPSGINYSQNGTTITVTTDGCIVIPVDQNLCESNDTASQTTGISVLTRTTIISSEVEGITSTNPFILDTFNSLAVDFSSCTINADSNYAPSTINADVCIDISDNASQIANVPDVTVTLPVTFSVNSTSNNSVVNDCMTTGAPTIFDNATGDAFIQQPDGSYLLVSDF